MNDPHAEWKSAAIGRYRNGDTIRTDTFRFTEYTNAKGKQTSRMLYDHTADPDEDVNTVESRTQAVTELAEQLHRLMGRDSR